jgi:hypothetical protein
MPAIENADRSGVPSSRGALSALAIQKPAESLRLTIASGFALAMTGNGQDLRRLVLVAGV